MKATFALPQSFVVAAIGLAVVAAPGCEGDRATSALSPGAPTIQPKVSPSKGAVEDLKKDLRPPVVVKPNTAPSVETIPAPKHE